MFRCDKKTHSRPPTGRRPGLIVFAVASCLILTVTTAPATAAPRKHRKAKPTAKRGKRRAAGAGKRPILDDGAVEAIHGASDGVPRRINNLATAALIVAAARGHKVVTAQDVVDARLDRGRS